MCTWFINNLSGRLNFIHILWKLLFQICCWNQYIFHLSSYPHTPAVRNGTHIRTHELCHNKPHSAVENLLAPTKTFQSCASFSNVRTCFQWCSRAGHRIRNGCLASRVHARVNCTTDRPHRQRVCADRKCVFPVFSITQRRPATGDAGGADDNVVMVSSSSSS